MNANVSGAPAHRPRTGPKRATASYLENAALHYLQRFATSSENLRRVLMRKVERSARAHGTDPSEGAAVVEALIRRYRESGLLDDRTYARAKAESLHRRGDSTRRIRQKLGLKGVDPDLVEGALDAVDADTPGDLDLMAALALARRRRLGPYRAKDREALRDKDLAALGRAGFPYDVARRVVDAEDPDALRAEAEAGG